MSEVLLLRNEKQQARSMIELNNKLSEYVIKKIAFNRGSTNTIKIGDLSSALSCSVHFYSFPIASVPAGWLESLAVKAISGHLTSASLLQRVWVLRQYRGHEPQQGDRFMPSPPAASPMPLGRRVGWWSLSLTQQDVLMPLVQLLPS